MRSGGALYPLLGDHLGSTAYTLSAATEFGEVRYKAFGATRFTSGTTPTTFRYTGQREESALGLYYYGARWYDPALGRFIQADTIVPDPADARAYDRYAYVLNNPLRYTDPTGHQEECPEQYQSKCGNGGGAMGGPPAGGGGGRIGGPGPNNGGGGFWNRLASPFRAAGNWIKSWFGGGEEEAKRESEVDSLSSVGVQTAGLSGRIVDAELPDELASTFVGGKYTSLVLDKDTVLYRAGTSSRPLGQFFSRDAPVSEIQVRIDKAVLPEWPDGGRSPIDTVFEVKIPAGTTVHVGNVGYQKGFYLGGTEQIVVVKPWEIEGVQVLNQWPIQK
jgi:RHS repeat-associated protein